MRTITETDFEKLKTKAVANVIAKLTNGGVPTRQEWDLISECRESGEDVPELQFDKYQKTTTSSQKMMKIISEAFDLSERKSWLWMEKLKEHKKGNVWNVRAILFAIRERKDYAASGGGANADLKRDIYTEQLEALRISNAIKRGELISREEFSSVIMTINNALDAMLEQFISFVASEFAGEYELNAARTMANSCRNTYNECIRKYATQ